MVFKYRKLLTSCAIILSTGGGWVCYQVHKIEDRINNIMNTDVLEVKKKNRAQYIYIPKPPITESYDDFKENIHEQKFIQWLSISQWWGSWKHSLAWRLLAMAQTGKCSDRLQAVRSLVEMKNLKDSDYRQLAQACDARTAVGLARTNGADLRFFLKPPYAHISYTRQELINDLHHLLQALNQEKHHPCLQYFLSKAFPDFQDRHKLFDHDHISIETPNSLIKGEDLLPLCLKNVAHHSDLEDNGRDIVASGGLRLLMAVYRHCAREMDVLVLLANLMASISVYQDLLEKLHQTGWIGVLAEWARHPDIRLSAPAVKALANLDTDDPLHGQYQRRVYLLHPAWRTTEPIKLDVVFVHGLLGGVFFTWRQRDHSSGDVKAAQSERKEGSTWPKVSDEVTQEYIDEVTATKQEEWEDVGYDFEVVMSDAPESTNGLATGPYCINSQHQCVLQSTAASGFERTQCWPLDWLSSDCRHLRVLGINYETSLSMWGPTCPAETARRALADRSEELLEKLHRAGIGQRPIVWVSHSMGGLLVKSMLVKAWESEDLQLQDLCRNTRAVVFYSVPHQGTPLAALTPTTQLLLSPTVEVQELRENSPVLQNLHEHFLEMLQDIPIEVVSFAETKATLIPALRLQFTFVPLTSADPGVGEFFEIPQDHLSICKPASRQSFLYQKVLHIINKLLVSS